MFELAAMNGPLQGAMTVGIVLAEALLLYVGYGGLVRVAGPELEAAIRER